MHNLTLITCYCLYLPCRISVANTSLSNCSPKDARVPMDRTAPPSLNVPLSQGFLRLVTGFAEESAKAFGLAAPEALKLTLAAEEIFTHVCQSAKADDVIGIEAVNGRYYALLRF